MTTIASNDTMVVMARGRYVNDRTETVVHQLELPTPEATLAARLIERWGIVAATVDGEDTAGRQKLRRLTPTGLVDEACRTAEIAMAEFRRRGWLLRVPPPDEIDALMSADEKSRPQKRPGDER
jgi:hypothetical protein